jgi:hypothetical protein
MTPDEVVKILENMLTEIACKQAPKIERLETPIYDVDFKLQALQSAISLLQDYQKLREKIKDKDNRLWAIIRCNACNGTTDCENSPECPENYDGCIADDILKEMQTYLQQPTEH